MGARYRFRGPRLEDPRLHVAAVLVTVQVLGQTALEFDLSISQILVAVVSGAFLEVVVTARRTSVIAWPASAMLTGNGIALILRVPGTEHGDWWSTRGLHLFAATSIVAVATKYVIRWGGRHLFNPSNVGLVLCFVLLGPQRVDPQDLWWGSWSPGLALTYAVIVAGGVLIGRELGMLGLAAAFWGSFAGCLAVLASVGHCMTARWRVGLVCDWEFWRIVVLSPEVLIFLFFMITDPRTTPESTRARVWYGVGLGVVAALLVAPQRTEFGTKVAILGALVIGCAAWPLLVRALPGRLPARPAQVALLGAGAAGWLVVGLALAGDRVRTSDGASVLGVDAGATLVTLPLPLGDVPPVPPVEISSEAREAAPGLDAGTGQRMAEDLAADLVLLAEATEQRNPGLAATAASGEYLRAFERDLAAAERSGVAMVPTYRFERMRIVVDRVEGNPQARPDLAIEVTGTVAHRPHGGTPATWGAPASEEPLRTVLVIGVQGDRYVITRGADP